MKASDSLTIRGKVIRNRITMAPTVKFDYAGPDGKATQKHIDHYRERAEHGCGLICVEATAVSPDGRFWTNHMGLWDDDQIEGHAQIAKVCHDNGAVVIVQINHTGITGNPELGTVIGPSAVPTRDPKVIAKEIAKEMSIDEIHKMQEKFVNAAIRAKKAGYDGVQLHGCHSYLINQFISRKTNLRCDEYGGSVENRARFGSEIISKIRKECGEDFIISIRTAGIEPDVATAIEIAEEYVKAGVDMLQVSTGIEWEDDSLKEEGEPYNLIVKLGVKFHEHFKARVPVSCVNSLYEPSVIRYLLENDLVDLVDLGRPILADPAIVEAVLEGKPFVKCFDCPNCQYGPFMPHKCPAAMRRGVKF